jgi:hypothetical protein
VLPIKALLCISFALIRFGLRVGCRRVVLFTGPELLGMVLLGIYIRVVYRWVLGLVSWIYVYLLGAKWASLISVLKTETYTKLYPSL